MDLKIQTCYPNQIPMGLNWLVRVRHVHNLVELGWVSEFASWSVPMNIPSWIRNREVKLRAVCVVRFWI